MLINISYQRKIVKATQLHFRQQGKDNKKKKKGFCPGVRLGWSLLGNIYFQD